METTKPARLRRHSHATLPAYTCEYRYYTIGAKGWNTGEVWRVTVCYLDIGPAPAWEKGLTFVGVAFCAQGDQYVKAIGRAIALGRARQVLLNDLFRQHGHAPLTRAILRVQLVAIIQAVGWEYQLKEKAAMLFRGYRLPSPKPLPLNPVLQGSFLTGEVGRTEDVRFVSIYADSRRPHGRRP